MSGARPVTPPRRTRGGFTFLEVMLVVMILGMAMAVVLPNMRPASRRATLEQAARRVIGMLRVARSTAVSTGRTLEVAIDFEKNTLELRDPVREEERDRERRGLTVARRDREAAPRAMLDDEDYVFSLGRDLSIREVSTYQELFEKDGRAVRLQFFPDGRSSRCTIVLGAQQPLEEGKPVRHRLYTIEVFHATGMISSYPGAPREAGDIGGTFEPLAGRRGRDARFEHLGRQR